MFHIRRLISLQTLIISNRNILKLNIKPLTQTSQIKSANTDPVVLSDSCVKRLKELNAKNNQYLRIIVDSGGCSGLEYKFSIEDKINKEDEVIEKEGCKVLIDKETVDYLKGSTIDYYEELIRSGFRVINNPNSEHGCSCGTSFSIKI